MGFPFKKKKHRLLKWIITGSGCLLPVIFILVVVIALVVMLMAVAGQGEQDAENSRFSLSAQVEAYRGVANEYAKQEGIEEYLNHILCMMEAETGGYGTDVMNAGNKEANTKFPKNRGSILDPSYSIECGVKEFKALIGIVGVTGPEDNVNLLTLYQVYHFGRDYYSFLDGKAHTNQLGEAYKKANAMGDEYDSGFAGQVAFYLNSLTAGTGEFIWPLPGQYTYISSYYGYRTHPITGEYRYHNGTDIPAPQGTPVYAIADGSVAFAIYGHPSYGNYVKINHSGVYASMYAHCAGLSVSSGQTVKQGEVIGYVGSTGWSTGPHLHIEMYVNGQGADALDYIGKTGGEDHGAE